MKRDTTPSWTDPRLARPTSYRRELQVGLLVVLLGLGGLFHHEINYRTRARYSTSGRLRAAEITKRIPIPPLLAACSPSAAYS